MARPPKGPFSKGPRSKGPASEPDPGDEPPVHGEPGEDEDLEGMGDLARAMQKAGPLLTLGWTIAASVALGVLGGVWLDDHLDTKPFFTITGSLFGIAAAVLQLVRTIERL